MSNQQSNQPTYADRLAALRRATMAAVEAAHNTTYSSAFAGTQEERAHAAYDKLYDGLRMALLCNADCPEQEAVAVAAGVFNMRIPIIGTVAPDGAVSWNSGGLL